MSGKDRLEDTQAALNQSGLEDIKFFFATRNKSVDQLKDDAVSVLDAYVNGKCIPFDLSELDSPLVE